MLDYYNEFNVGAYNSTPFTAHTCSLEERFISQIFWDFYNLDNYHNKLDMYDIMDLKFGEWLCAENLIGRELTPEIWLLYKLSSK